MMSLLLFFFADASLSQVRDCTVSRQLSLSAVRRLHATVFLSVWSSSSSKIRFLKTRGLGLIHITKYRISTKKPKELQHNRDAWAHVNAVWVFFFFFFFFWYGCVSCSKICVQWDIVLMRRRALGDLSIHSLLIRFDVSLNSRAQCADAEWAASTQIGR